MTDWYSNPNASLGKEWSKEDVRELKQKLITANHILHHYSVVDAYGHISIRHPQRPDIYIMCGYMAPALVSSSSDLIEYWVKGSEPVDPRAKKGYSERFIHGELFKMYPGVKCVVHSHAEDVLPYVTGGVPLLPVFHMAGFLGTEVPVFDIEKLYGEGERQDLLVRNERLGEGLASEFTSESERGEVPEHNVVLMRRHGFTTFGADIETAVYRAIYSKVNAAVQTNAMLTWNAFVSALGSSQGLEAKFPFEPLTEAMCEGCDKMNTGTQDKPWRLWVKEVEENRLYVNNG